MADMRCIKCMGITVLRMPTWNGENWRCEHCGHYHTYENKNAGPVQSPDEIQIGKKYKHFRSGGIYVVLGLAVLEEDLDTLVIYAEWNPINGLSKKVWARRKSVFFELVEDPNVPVSELKMPDLKRPLVPRFQLWSKATTDDNGIQPDELLGNKDKIILQRLNDGITVGMEHAADIERYNLAKLTTKSMIPGCQ